MTTKKKRTKEEWKEMKRKAHGCIPLTELDPDTQKRICKLVSSHLEQGI